MILMVGKLAIEVWRPHRMSGPTVNMPCFSMTVIRFGMHMEKRHYEHPQSRPYRDNETKA
jgi:hypothetical protein